MFSKHHVSAAGNEICAGCGTEARPFKTIENDSIVTKAGVQPWCGVGSPDLDRGTTPEGEDGPNSSEMVAYPVCDACHKDPGHRTLNKLKVHFFQREQRGIAVAAARAQILRT
jgi:hypothetical protein